MSLIFSALKTMEDAEARTLDILNPTPQPRRIGRWQLLAALGVVTAVVAGGVGLGLWLPTTHSESRITKPTSDVTGPIAGPSASERTLSKSTASLPAETASKSQQARVTQPKAQVTTIATPRSTMTLTKMPKLAAMPSPSVEPSVEDQMPPKLAAIPSKPAQPKAAAVVKTAQPPVAKVSLPGQSVAAVNRHPTKIKPAVAMKSAPAVMVAAAPHTAMPVKKPAKPEQVAMTEAAPPITKPAPNPAMTNAGSNDDPDTQAADAAAITAANKEILTRRSEALRVAQLMTEFRAAVASGDLSTAKQKLAAIQSAAAPDSLTLLRARAYWELTQKHLSEAMVGYRSILARVPDDRDAGLNLAVTEWQAGQKSDALTRMESLAKRFPDDQLIQRYERVMEGR